MFSSWKTIALACWKPVQRYARMRRAGGEDNDPMIWSQDIARHFAGELSFAVAQANDVIEDHSQVETGREATFVGIYDGHGGPDASLFVAEHLFEHLMLLARENGTISEDVLKGAFSATEGDFLAHVRRTRENKPLITAMGTCCIVGVIWRETLYVANLGDSRAVIGCLGRSEDIIADQLSRDDNASLEEVRQELMSQHPDDPEIVTHRNGAWRIKGLIQISKSIGDAYMKSPEFTVDPSFPRFRLPEPLRRPVLGAVPTIYTRALGPQDKFIVFASDGLWELLTNQEVVETVHNYPKAGIARRLVRMAVDESAKKRQLQHIDLIKLGRGVRRCYHDDITVAVVFIDHGLLRNPNDAVPELSIRGFVDVAGPSKFSMLDGI